MLIFGKKGTPVALPKSRERVLLKQLIFYQQGNPVALPFCRERVRPRILIFGEKAKPIRKKISAMYAYFGEKGKLKKNYFKNTSFWQERKAYSFRFCSKKIFHKCLFLVKEVSL